MLPGRKYSPEEVLRLIVAHKWTILLPLAVGLATAPWIATRIPEQYRSETLIMVIPQRIPDSYVRSTVTAKLEERLPSITDQIQSRSRLERIITDLDLYKTERERWTMEDTVQRMRGDIKVGLEGRAKESFRVSYVSRDPRTAQKVTERLASLYIEENLRDRENLAESTNTFLASQLEDAKRRLLEHERKLEDYRRRHAGELPSQLEGNLQAIQNVQLQLQAVSESLNRARERRLLVQRQMNDARALPVTYSQPAGAVQPETALTAAQQLQAAEARLEVLRMRFTADHPDVRALERAIRELQAKAKEEAARPRQPAADKPLSPIELAQETRLRDLQAEVDIIDRQIAASQGEEARLKKMMADYQAKVDAVPSRESELVELTRDYAILQAAYSGLLTKYEDSKLAANLERRQIGEQFRILDSASRPEKPDKAVLRLALTFTGALAGLFLGVGLVALGEYRNTSFRHQEEVAKILGVAVLALVPAMKSERERQAQRRKALFVNLAGTAALIASAAVLVLWRLQL